MKKFLSLLVFIAISSLAFAQQNYQDVVYLKNGSIIRGIIIEQVPNKSIKLETADKNVFVYQMDEIEKLTKEIVQGRSNYSNSSSGLEAGYQGIVEMGDAIGVGGYGNALKLNVINGCRINPYFSLGFGTGLRYYFDYGYVVVPLFVDFRANFINKKVSPYLALDVGCSSDVTDIFVSFLLNPTAGVSFKISDKSAINGGIGYEIPDPYSDGGISINVGISF